jgi:S1-C subfamily serine protease
MLFALALLAAPRTGDAPPAGCAWVRAENDGAGAGFVVDARARLLVTCRHVVADRKRVDVFFPWLRGGAPVTDRREYLRERARLRERRLLVTGTVLKTADDLDLALVRLDALPPGTRAVTFAPPPGPGARLRVVGHRLDLDTLWNATTGPLRAAGELADGYFWRGQKLARGADVLIGQWPIEEGDSGGPVFDARGGLVGMACALRRQCPLAAVAVSGTAIRAFVGATGDPPAAGPEAVAPADVLARATVWVKPTATEVHLAGVLIEADLVLTCARGVSADERVGVALPLRDGGRLVSERGAYRDPLALHLRGAWRGGTVLARDPVRDLALVRLDAGAADMKPVPLAGAAPRAGDELHTMSHPGGLEFAWAYAAGAVRQTGPVALAAGADAPRVAVLVCQLPAQTGSPGGPVLNARGELVGVLSAREGAQAVGYAATGDEVRAFLDAARRDRPARTLPGLLARLEDLPAAARALARGLAGRAEGNRTAGRLADAARDADAAVALDPACMAARLCRARMLPPDDARAELDAALGRGGFDRGALVLRADLAARAKDWRAARGALGRVLDVFPADADARRRLVGALLGLGEDAKAAAAVGDALRADPNRLAAVAGDLLAQADALEQKLPDAPGVAADWLARAVAAAGAGTSDAGSRAALAAVLAAARGAKDDADRLRVLRAGVRGIRNNKTEEYSPRRAHEGAEKRRGENQQKRKK